MKTLPAIFAIAISAVTAPVFAQQDFSKAEIKAEQLAPGVAVLFGVGGNIGVSYGEDGTILIDDQYAPLTPKIQAAVSALGAAPVKFLVNTHWHGDHSGGKVRRVVAAADKVLAIADDNTKIIPGHGVVATKADLLAYRNMVAEIIAKVEAGIKAGKSLDAIKAERPADGYGVNPNGFITADRFVETVYNMVKS